MNVTIAIDSFKECASSTELAMAIKKGIQPFADEIALVPISDGGEGAIEAIAATHQGRLKEVVSVNPFGEAIHESYFLTTIDDLETAVIESAHFVGIHFLKGRKEQSYLGSSYGLGLAIVDAVQQGVKQIILTLGGSGTTDGGLGMLQGLGAQLLDPTRQPIPIGSSNPLLTTYYLELEPAKEVLKNVSLIIANDVDNPYYGVNGAAAVFGPQKGLNHEQIEQLDKQLMLIAENAKQQGLPDLAVTAGAGAAGGLGGAFALLGAKMEAGFSLFSRLTNLEDRLIGSSWVITGEGRFDNQSNGGKVPFGVAQLAQKHKIPVLLLCGSYEEVPEQSLFSGVFSIQREPATLQQAMEKAYALHNIEMVSHEIFRLLTNSQN